jgi:hypothetical protein
LDKKNFDAPEKGKRPSREKDVSECELGTIEAHGVFFDVLGLSICRGSIALLAGDLK